MSERKAVLITVALDRDMAEMVKKVAEQETEGNRSQAVRRMIRSAAPAILEQNTNPNEANQAKR